MFRARLSQDPHDPRFQELVRIVRQTLHGSEPVSPDTPFGEIEDVAHAIGQAVAREVCLQAAAEQAASAEQAQSCPECGRPCAGDVATRALITRDGPVDLPEARHHCPHCRRAFFPQPTPPGTDPSRLQPQGHRRPGHRRRRRLV